jgi:hypothetical protein
MQTWIAFFIVVTALAVVIQAVILTALFIQLRRSVARTEQVVTDLHARLTPVLSRVQILVEEVAPRINGIVSDAAELTRVARNQAQRVDRILSEALERLRLQLIHVDQILTGAIETVEEAGSYFRRSVWGPVAKAVALMRGIQVGLEVFRTTRRKDPRGVAEPPAEQPQDEGMFI